MAKKLNKKTEIIPAQPETYFQERMAALGIADTGALSIRHESTEYWGTFATQPVFAQTEQGNIQISYPSLYGGLEYVDGTETPFTRLRFHPDNQPDPKVKYYQAPGTGIHIFFPLAIVEKFKNKTPIQNLWAVEGEFKAQAGSDAGLDIIGIGGKDSFRDISKTALHPDIMAIIRDCAVESFGLLLDADTLAIKWNVEDEPEKDLSKSLWGFRSTAMNFREACTNAGIKDSYFAYLQRRLLKEPIGTDPEKCIKGLDDLLESRRSDGTIDIVLKDLVKLTGARAFFTCHNLGAMMPAAINKIFWLDYGRGNIPQSFWENNIDQLGGLKFKFNKALFQRNVDTGLLECVKHADSDQFVRIGCDWYKEIEIPDQNGEIQQSLVSWKASEISRDYGQNFFKGVARYNAFCVVPCHTQDYQQVINGCYNLYNELTHVPVEGKWDNIAKLIKHCFGERVLVPAENGKPALTTFDMMLDYWTLLYTRPTQMLPIIALYSKENNTGKSTMMRINEMIFMNNYAEVTNAILEDDKNDDWAPKLVVGLDEGVIEKNKTYQMMKSLSTAPYIMLRSMYAGRKKIPWFGKFWIVTNDLGFIKLEPGDTRFFINKVPKLTEDDPNFAKKLREEIPAFLYHIANRDIKFPQKSRHWFAHEHLVTEIGNKIKENSRGWFEKEIRVIMRGMFDKYHWHSLYFTHDELIPIVNYKGCAKTYRSDEIRDQLESIFGMVTVFNRWQQPYEPKQDNPEQAAAEVRTLGTTYLKHKRCYEFRIEDFYTEAEINEQFANVPNILSVIQKRAGTRTVVITDEGDDDDMPF